MYVTMSQRCLVCKEFSMARWQNERGRSQGWRCRQRADHVGPYIYNAKEPGLMKG